MTDKEKAAVDAMTYEDMLRHVRFDAIGSKYFVSGTPLNDYFQRSMADKLDEIGFEGHVEASKRIGW